MPLRDSFLHPLPPFPSRPSPPPPARQPSSSSSSGNYKQKPLSIYSLISSYATPPPSYPLATSNSPHHPPTYPPPPSLPPRNSLPTFHPPPQRKPRFPPPLISPVPASPASSAAAVVRFPPAPAKVEQEEQEDEEGDKVPLATAAAPFAGAGAAPGWYVGGKKEEDVLGKGKGKQAKEKEAVVEKTRRSLPPLSLLLLPLIATFLAASLLILLVLLSPVLARPTSLRQTGLLKVRVENVTVVLGPLGACFPLPPASASSSTPSRHYNCTSPSLTPVFRSEFYSSLPLSSSTRSLLPSAFPLFPTALVLSLSLLLLGILALVGLTFPTHPSASTTTTGVGLFFSPRRLFLIAASTLILSFSAGLAASLSQRATLLSSIKAVAATAQEEVEIQLGRAWTLLWVAFSLVGGGGVFGGAGGALLFERRSRGRTGVVEGEKSMV